MAPEMKSGRYDALKADIYAFGILALVLLGGEEPTEIKEDIETESLPQKAIQHLEDDSELELVRNVYEQCAAHDRMVRPTAFEVLSLLSDDKVATPKRPRADFPAGSVNSQGFCFFPGNDLEFMEKIGSGHEGDVFRGKWFGSDVAVKVSREGDRYRPTHEHLNLLKRVSNHENILRFMGCCENGVVFEFCSGKTLKSALLFCSKGGLRVRDFLLRAKTWIAEISAGMMFVTAARVCHRE
jgi:serine/threonine protein kinase